MIRKLGRFIKLEKRLEKVDLPLLKKQKTKLQENKWQLKYIKNTN